MESERKTNAYAPLPKSERAAIERHASDKVDVLLGGRVATITGEIIGGRGRVWAIRKGGMASLWRRRRIGRRGLFIGSCQLNARHESSQPCRKHASCNKTDSKERGKVKSDSSTLIHYYSNSILCATSHRTHGRVNYQYSKDERSCTTLLVAGCLA